MKTRKSDWGFKLVREEHLYTLSDMRGDSMLMGLDGLNDLAQFLVEAAEEENEAFRQFMIRASQRLTRRNDGED